jgi:hypothetical protein
VYLSLLQWLEVWADLPQIKTLENTWSLGRNHYVASSSKHGILSWWSAQMPCTEWMWEKYDFTIQTQNNQMCVKYWLFWKYILVINLMWKFINMSIDPKSLLISSYPVNYTQIIHLQRPHFLLIIFIIPFLDVT